MSDEIHVITMPKLGETVTEGTVGAWLKAVGDTVEFDDPLFEVSTDKVDSEIPSPFDGVLLEILVQPGETVAVGTELAKIGLPGASVASTPTGPAAAAASATPAVAAAPAVPEPAAAGGAAEEITMPKLGETVTEGTVGAWLKAVGDTVEFDDPLFEVSTDKVDSEIPSPVDGVLQEILVQAGETVAVGTVLARIVTANGAAAPAATTTAAPALVAATAAAAPAPAAAPAAVRPGPAAPSGNGSRLLSPVVRKLAAEHNIDLSAVAGSGGAGRIMREDVLAAIAAGKTAAPAAPAAGKAAASAAAADGKAAAPATVDSQAEVVPLSRIRTITAERMLQSRQTSPHVWTSVEVDLERIEQIRQKHKERFKKENGASLTYLPFIALATCDALRAFPTVNSSVNMTDKTMTLHKQVHLAIAVDLNEQGLMAPVVKNADSLNLRGMAKGIKDVADRAKNKTLKSDDLSGSTFTLTNPGPLGSFASAAIINQPNVAIMSTEGVTRRPVVVGDAIAIHHTCVLGFSYDHRAFDGVTASRFLMFIRDALQERDWEADLG
ncbi:2-oxoglutarate dehydrogenase, E2 component, dihydrolipoamide succinyltransferase [Mycolicibacterium gadium]|uniref:Dihydrolipoamide acetyltransferase component of pyruvate dehydrogenase complex n=1 Tax=Mycolicibacterium gadium TaxID=1794 RepID=A0ABT6H019_MYCGU|nr:2-oxoglutarate dehydrogenase, E2 component, dihydrolipoamide succinyltransferase [Mycolicibacterium gadium]MDG5486696.1 2-oxoglutarate dehydrogenase, E2 component, dihydrolipoamide succinyltransferase [Mycolicibacterium gadium]